jgi:predicted nuclease with TOPRIM domain
MSDNRKIYPNEEVKELQVVYQSAKILKEIIKEDETFEEIEAKLLEQWDKKVALQSRIFELEDEYKEAKEVLDDWNNKSNPLYEKYKNCMESLVTRIDKLKKQLSEMA